MLNTGQRAQVRFQCSGVRCQNWKHWNRSRSHAENWNL